MGETGDYDSEFVASLLAADAAEPEAVFSNFADMLAWLDSEVAS